MIGGDAATMKTLKTDFSTKSIGFKGCSHDTGGMNWFKSGNGTDSGNFGGEGITWTQSEDGK